MCLTGSCFEGVSGHRAQLLNPAGLRLSPAISVLPMGSGRSFWTPSREEAWVCSLSPLHVTTSHLCFAVAFGCLLRAASLPAVFISRPKWVGGKGQTEACHQIALSLLRRASPLARSVSHTPVFHLPPSAFPACPLRQLLTHPFYPERSLLLASRGGGVFAPRGEKPHRPSCVFKGGVSGKQGSGDFPSTR